MKDNKSIRDLASKLEDRFTKDVEPAPVKGVSAEKIKKRTLGKIHGSLTEPEKRIFRMKKKTFAAVVVAAVICLASVTALAVTLTGSDFFGAIFGESVKGVEESIVDPRLTATQGDYTLTVESLLSDGYRTHIIVSVADEKGRKLDAQEESLLSVTDSKDRITMYQWNEMTEFGMDGKKYFDFEATSKEPLTDGTLIVTLTPQNGASGVSIEIEPATSLAFREIELDSEHYEGMAWRASDMSLSPMGFLVRILPQADDAAKDIPVLRAYVIFTDGTREELCTEVPLYIDEGSQGGGGVALHADGPVRLVEVLEAHYTSGSDITVSGQFTRIIDLAKVEAVEVDGVSYPVN